MANRSMTNKFSHGYALLIGVGESTYPRWSLPVTVKDVQALRTILTDPTLCGYPDDDAHIRLLHDTDATKEAILDGLAWLAQQTAADSDATAVVFYSGHGWLDDSMGRYYLLPHDVEPFDLAASALPAAAFTDALRQVKARRLLVFVDSCHAAGMATAKDVVALKLPMGFSQAALPKGLVEDLKQGAGRAVFTSSLGEQRSWVRPDGSLSLYTFHLIEALQGAGNQPGDTTVRVSNLMNHLGKAVPESARTLCQAEQTPFFDAATEDFAVALLLGGKGLSGAGFSPAQDGAASQPAIEASGERSVAAETISDSTVVTGDRNIVQQGKYNIHIGSAQGLVTDDLIRQILDGQQETQAVFRDRLQAFDGRLMEIRALLTQLARTAGNRGVQVQQGISGSIIITGDNNHISLFDGGRLAQWWNEVGPDPEILLPQYLAETTRAYESLLFLPGHTSKPVPLDEVYVEIPIIKPVTDEAFLRRRHPGTRQSGDDLIRTDEIIRRDECAALIGFLGAGKTTTLRYLAWVYARRSEDYSYWRGQEIVPFYVRARDLARMWTEPRRSEGVEGFTSALAEATAVSMPSTLGRRSIGRILELSLNQGRAMVLLDALDEFHASDQERSDFMTALQTLWKAISFEGSSRSNRILLTSRPYRFLNPLGFTQYGLLDIEHDVSWLISRLGGAILRQHSDLSPAQVDAWLEGLSCAICQPRLREFWIPFYVTLMIYLGTGNASASEGVALLDSIGRLTDLYNVFVYQTIAWERSRSKLSLPDDTELRYVLGHVAHHTLLQPLNADDVKLVIADEMRCSLSEAGQLLGFWLGTGFLSIDETQNAFLFCHSGFQAYGMAFMLTHWWHHGQRQRVEDISRRYLLVPEWDTVWKLFEGLR